MKPIFFPFTSLTQYDAKSVLSFFDTFFYLSTQSDEELAQSEPEWFQTLWRETLSLEPVTLSSEELTPLLASIKSWRLWAEANYGKTSRSGYLKSIFRENPYFTSDTDIVAIRSQIERGVSSAVSKDIVAEEDSGHSLNRAMLFLRLAMMADRENEAIDQQLLSIDRLEAELFSELHGELDNDLIAETAPRSGGEEPGQFSATASDGADRGEFMTEERVRSWLTLLVAKQSHFKDLSSVVFVTTSRAAIYFLLSVSKKSKLMLDIDNFKVHKEKNSPCAGAWSETYKVQWNDDFHRTVKSVLSKAYSSSRSDLYMNITDSELFQVAAQGMTVMLVGVKE